MHPHEPVQPDLLTKLQSIAKRIRQEQGYALIVLFGSAARGEPFADLDIGVVGAGPIDAIALTNKLTAALDFQDVDVCDLRRADPLLMQLAARDGVALFDPTGSAFAEFASLAARRFYDTQKFRDLEHQEILEFLERHTGRS